MKRCLVTGGAGFIGSALVHYLLSGQEDAAGVGRVVVLDKLTYAGRRENLAECDQDPRFRFFQGDIADSDRVGQLLEEEAIDAVFHLAAEARIQPTIEDPLKAFENNMIGTATVLECARSCGVKRVVYSSTSAAYGLANTPPMVETMSTDCLNPYSVSKVAGEEMCKMYARLYGMETVTFRYFNVYGERQPLRGQYAPVIGIFLRQRATGEPMTVVGDGTQRRDFTYVGDVVAANIRAATITQPADYQWGQIYNIGTGINYSINEIAALMGGETVTLPPRLAESRLSLADTTKTNIHIGWTSKVRLEEWIAEHK